MLANYVEYGRSLAIVSVVVDVQSSCYGRTSLNVMDIRMTLGLFKIHRSHSIHCQNIMQTSNYVLSKIIKKKITERRWMHKATTLSHKHENIHVAASSTF